MFFAKSLWKALETGDGGNEGGWYGHHEPNDLFHTWRELNLCRVQ